MLSVKSMVAQSSPHPSGLAPYLQGSAFISQFSPKPQFKCSQTPPTISPSAGAAVSLNNSESSDFSWIEGKADSAKGGGKTWSSLSSERLEGLQKKPAERRGPAKLAVLSHHRLQSSRAYQPQTRAVRGHNKPFIFLR